VACTTTIADRQLKHPDHPDNHWWEGPLLCLLVDSGATGDGKEHPYQTDEVSGQHKVPLRRLVQFKMNYGPGDNMISTLYEGTVDKEAIRIDANEIERIVYHSLSEIEASLAQGEGLLSRWFEQLLLWYLGRPSEIQVIDNHPEA
jgi:hypothetical protein